MDAESMTYDEAITLDEGDLVWEVRHASNQIWPWIFMRSVDIQTGVALVLVDPTGEHASMVTSVSTHEYIAWLHLDPPAGYEVRAC